MKRGLAVAVCFLLATACMDAQIPVLVDAATANQHLLNRDQPVYPPIARAAHISGLVIVGMKIGPNGNVALVKVLSGPPMLQNSVGEAVRHYTYRPFQQNGKPVDAIVIVAAEFLPNGSVALGDAKGSTGFFESYLNCDWKLADATPADQVEACRTATEQVENLPVKERDIFSRRAYMDYAVALVHNVKPADAAVAGDKAIAAMDDRKDHPLGTAAAYAVTGQAQGMAGNLVQADKDLTLAEKYQKTALQLFAPTFRRPYLSAMKSTLEFHATVLTKMGNQKEAEKKLKEAAKL